MREYIGHPAFWISIILVVLVVNFLWMKFAGGKGKLL